MPNTSISFRDTSFFSTLICDYLDEKASVRDFYNRFPKLEHFKPQIEEKQRNFPSEHRDVLVDVLQEQYALLDASSETEHNITLLKKDTTFTITTGHQLNLFTGPLYFLYKIIATINLAELLKKEHPDYDFVPIYWMATEDHDFDEINYFNLFGRKIQWNHPEGGAVGDFDTLGLDKVFEVLKDVFGKGKHADDLQRLFEESYLKHNNLADATRFLANTLFKTYGLVILDANTPKLKQVFAPYMEEELVGQTAHKKVRLQTEALKASGYNVQVNPREINLFYLQKRLRERIIEKDGTYFVNETEISWNKEDLLKELSEFPERFSPNVIMRPLYQEVILPNLCYIGGGGELAYWMELKSYFEVVKVPFPILLLRNSALLVKEKQAVKLKKLDLKIEELFMKPHELINYKVRRISNILIDFQPQKKQLKQQFKELYEIAAQTDQTFLNAVKAQEVKQLKGLDALEKRLLKAQKRKLSDQVERMRILQNELFPNNSLQERKINFSEMYLEYGEKLIPYLKNNMNPLTGDFIIMYV